MRKLILAFIILLFPTLAFAGMLTDNMTITNNLTVNGTLKANITTTYVNSSEADITNLTVTNATGDYGNFTDVVATNITIGANTLTTSEWAYLDGTNQALKTTDNVSHNNISAGNISVTGVIVGYWNASEILALENLTNYFNGSATLALGNLTNYFNGSTTLALDNLTNYANWTQIDAIENLTNYPNWTELLAVENLTNYFNGSTLLALSNLTNYLNYSQLGAIENLTNYANWTQIDAIDNLTNYPNWTELLAVDNLTYYFNGSTLLALENLTNYFNGSTTLALDNLTNYLNYTQLDALDNLTNYANWTELIAVENFTNYFNNTALLALANLTNYYNKSTILAVQNDSAAVGTNPAINFLPGDNVQLVVENGTNRVNVTINANVTGGIGNVTGVGTSKAGNIPQYNDTAGIEIIDSNQPISIIGTLQDNDAILAYQLQSISAVSIFGYEDGVADSFYDATGIDATASLNETYNTTGDFYENEIAAANNESAFSIALIDSPGSGYNNTTGRAIASAAGIADHSYNSFKVQFKAHSTTILKIKTAYLGEQNTGINFKASPAKVKLTFGGLDNATISAGSSAYSDWVTFNTDGTTALLVSYDVGDSSYITYTSVNGNGAGITVGVQAANDTATFSSDGATYGYIVDAINGNYSDTKPMTLISINSTAYADPASARLIAMIEPVDAITINTDVKGYVSEDGGANWEQVTFVNETITNGTTRVYAGSVNITDRNNVLMARKITTENLKRIRIRSWSEYWKAE